jgi:activator of 2-hydroxyglutaryl-CoA dehydratase
MAKNTTWRLSKRLPRARSMRSRSQLAPLLTGGLALDEGLLAALQEGLVNEKITGLTAVSHPDSIYAGAIGAALWGAFRFRKLREMQERIAA